ncbi:MAG: hypothetical protein ACREYE_04040, partial [Gammaproteobacteria bacterium]
RTSSRRSSGRGSRWSRSSPDPPCLEGKEGGLTVKLFKGHYTSIIAHASSQTGCSAREQGLGE